MHILIFRLFSL